MTHSVEPSLAGIPASYRLILCDIWGCVHDGVTIFPDAQELLLEWRRQGRIVLLITNAPRPAGPVRAQLDRLGLDRAAYDDVITSGDTGIAALEASGVRHAGFIGTAADRAVLREAGVELAEGTDGEAVVCTGFPDGIDDVAELDEILAAMRGRKARLLCFNPDRVVIRGGVREPCAGSIADRYEAMGGAVLWYGKPYAPIYERALAVAGRIARRAIEPGEVAAVGDSLRTDFVGAQALGFAFVFITHGIEGEKIASEGIDAIVGRFSAEQGMALPPPLAVAGHLH